MQWTNSKPTVEGWYFRKARRNTKDPWKWDAYYIMVCHGRITYWLGGTEDCEPKGGWWWGPIPLPGKGGA